MTDQPEDQTPTPEPPDPEDLAPPEPEVAASDEAAAPTDETGDPNLRGWVRVTFMHEGAVGAEWQGVGAVDLLAAGEYIKWQAQMMLAAEHAARIQRAQELARIMGTGSLGRT